MYKQFSPGMERSPTDSDGPAPVWSKRPAVSQGPVADHPPALRQSLNDPAVLSQLPPTVASTSLLQMQRLSGNLSVQRLVQLSRGGAEGGSEVSPSVERAIESSRGAGHPLDGVARAQIGGALNADFSGVRVHTDSRANGLNESLGARAFTTGQDIYFRQGEYNPGSSRGRDLLAHELTHVVQQNPGVVQAARDEEGKGLCPACKANLGRSLQAKLTVSSPGDIYEQEADSVAREFSRREQLSAPASAVSRQTVGEEKKDEKLHTKSVDGLLRRQPEEEQDKDTVARTKGDDEELHRKPEDEELKKHG